MKIMLNFKIMLLSALAFTIGTFAAKADTIILKDATTINAFNVEEAGKWIIYTQTADSESALQRISIDKVFAIKTQDGEIRTVGETATSNQVETPKTNENDNKQNILEPKVAANNAALIDAYNQPRLQLKKPKDEKFKERYGDYFISLWGVSQNSILADDNIEITLVPFMPEGSRIYEIPQLKTKIANKTDSPIYIDLANSFKYGADGSVHSYYSGAVYTEGKAGSTGVAVGMLSGIGISQTSSTMSSITKAEERILMIPPRGSVYLPPLKWSENGNIYEAYETLYFRNEPFSQSPWHRDNDLRRSAGNRGYINYIEREGGIDDTSITQDDLKAPIGWTRDFTEEDTPKKLHRVITYSTSDDFSTCTQLSFQLYMRSIMGSNMRWNVPKHYLKSYFVPMDENHVLFGVGKVRKSNQD